MGWGGTEEKPNAQPQQAAIPLNPLLGLWRRNPLKGPAASVSLWIKSGDKKKCANLMPINPVGIASRRMEGFHMETSFGDSWVTCSSPLLVGSCCLLLQGNNSRARLSMSDASCMPLGDPGKVHSSLGKCSLDHPFLSQCNPRGASTDKFNSWRPYLTTFSWLVLCS